MAKASVVVPSRGGAQRLPHLLTCLSQQTNQQWEAIVVLDGDIDDSESVVEKLKRDLPVRTIVFPENRGRVAALNAGFSEANGDVLIRCDDDLRPGRDYIEEHVNAHAEEPCGAVGLVRNVLPENAYGRVYGQATDIAFREQAYASPASARWRYWAANVSTTRELWDAVGPYDSDYRAYGWEDVDWGYRLARLGVAIKLIPALETPHHAAAISTHSRASRAFHSGAARHTFEKKHGTSMFPQPEDAHKGPWELLVHTLARATTNDRIDTWAPRIDAILPMLPRSIAQKMVAATVEASAEAGYQRPGNLNLHI